MGCGPARRGPCADGKGLLQNREMRSHLPHTSSDARISTIKPDCCGISSSLARAPVCCRVLSQPGGVGPASGDDAMPGAKRMTPRTQLARAPGLPLVA